MKKANILFLETGTPTLNGGAGGSLVSLFEIIKGIHDENKEVFIQTGDFRFAGFILININMHK